MINVFILELEDKIDPNDWCRPLVLTRSLSDAVYDTSEYGGYPTNNLKWVKVKQVFGQCWFGATVKNMRSQNFVPYEFIRGSIPMEHML